MDEPRVILIRTDSSKIIGTGHVMRDLVLASKYPHAKIIFATQNLDGNIDHVITGNGYGLHTLQSDAITKLDEAVKQYDADMLIIDHYGIGYDCEKTLKTNNPGLVLFVLDDTYQKHYCDILLNHNIYAQASRYKTLVPRRCRLLCGQEHMLLRKEFYKAKAHKRRSQKLFVAMGGNDVHNFTPAIMEALKARRIAAHVVTTSANPNLALLQQSARQNKDITLHIDSAGIASIMADCGGAVVSASTVLNEVIFMNLPFIALQTAHNQRYMVRYLRQNDHMVLERMEPDMLHLYLQKLQMKMETDADRKK